MVIPHSRLLVLPIILRKSVNFMIITLLNQKLWNYYVICFNFLRMCGSVPVVRAIYPKSLKREDI